MTEHTEYHRRDLESTYPEAFPIEVDPEPKVCGDVSWCGLPAGHEPVWRGAVGEPAALDGHRVTADGVYEMTPEVYHADPVLERSLSSTGARRLLPPSCPAKFAYLRENEQPSTKDQDYGSAAHRVLLGEGPDFEVIPPDPSGKWDRKDTKAKLATARAAGRVPVKPDDMAEIEAMVAALRDHPTAGPLFRPGTGRPEVVIVWTDPDTGVRCRAMLDWLQHTVDGVIDLGDYKTTTDGDGDAVSRTVARWRYHMQLAFYRRGLLALGLADVVRCYDVFQERDAPYLLHVAELDARALAIGDYENDQALAIYRDCSRTGIWPGYGTGDDGNDPSLIGLPIWEERRYEDVI